MAEKLKEFDFQSASKLTTAPKGEYPWDQWFDGDIWLLTVGEDFQGHPLMMERVIRTSATNRQAKVNMRHIALNGDPWGQIVLQRRDIVGPAETKRQARKDKAAATRAAKKAPAKKANRGAVEAPVKEARYRLIDARKASRSSTASSWVEAPAEAEPLAVVLHLDVPGAPRRAVDVAGMGVSLGTGGDNCRFVVHSPTIVATESYFPGLFCPGALARASSSRPRFCPGPRGGSPLSGLGFSGSGSTASSGRSPGRVWSGYGSLIPTTLVVLGHLLDDLVAGHRGLQHRGVLADLGAEQAARALPYRPVRRPWPPMTASRCHGCPRCCASARPSRTVGPSPCRGRGCARPGPPHRSDPSGCAGSGSR